MGNHPAAGYWDSGESYGRPGRERIDESSCNRGNAITEGLVQKPALQPMKPLLTGDARTVAEWVGRELDLAYTHQGWSLYERPDLSLQEGTE